MRVAVITPADAPHSRFLCAALGRAHELVGVLHPVPPPASRRDRLRQLQRETRRVGPVNEALRLLATRRSPLRGWDLREDERAALERRFADLDGLYERHAAPVAAEVADVNGPEARERLRALAPDVVCCLGGPIYREPLIRSVPLMLNFHSGISPIWNGASTIAFAYAHGTPALCGGTLMTMDPAVDGGDLLAHYLPAVEPGDTPGSLFAKTVRGATEAYLAALAHLAAGGRLAGVPQPPPVFYTRSSDWTVWHGQRVRRTAGRLAPAHVREARLATYWDAGSPEEARRRVQATIAGLLAL
jgi:folate-dependent phosphoribosylglycinamide formyltransferase PurN